MFFSWVPLEYDEMNYLVSRPNSEISFRLSSLIVFKMGNSMYVFSPLIQIMKRREEKEVSPYDDLGCWKKDEHSHTSIVGKDETIQRQKVDVRFVTVVHIHLYHNEWDTIEWGMIVFYLIAFLVVASTVQFEVVLSVELEVRHADEAWSARVHVQHVLRWDAVRCVACDHNKNQFNGVLLVD